MPSTFYELHIYALVLNDLFEPLHFIKSDGRALDQIVAGSKDTRMLFGRHATPPENSGLIIMSKSVFNLDKTIIWIAGITGMGTQAVTAFFKNLLRGQAHIDDRAIGCVIGPVVKTGVNADISQYYRKWRISDYEGLCWVDQDGNVFQIKR